MPEFAEWDSFYVIVGSTAGGPDRIAVRRHDADRREAAKRRAGGHGGITTPTIVHFATVLFLACNSACPMARDHARGHALGSRGAPVGPGIPSW